MTSETTTTPTPNLTDLVAAMAEAREVHPEIWPKCLSKQRHIVVGGQVFYSYNFDSPPQPASASPYGFKSPINHQHAHDILTAHAERWLRAKGWECVSLAYNTGHNYWCKEDWNLKGVDSLASAIRAEMGRGG